MLTFQDQYGTGNKTTEEENQAVITGEEEMSKEDFAQAVKESVLSLESLLVATNELIIADRFSVEALRVASMNRDAHVCFIKGMNMDLKLESEIHSSNPETVGYGSRFILQLKNDIAALKELVASV